MKNNQRLSYHRLAEELAERDLVDPDALNSILEEAAGGGRLLPMALLEASLISDWELSRVVCEIYNLPFLSVEMVSPVADAMEGLDPAFLIEVGLVPLSRHGSVLTVCMPAIVGAPVIQQLSSATGLEVLTVVGTVASNLHWLEENVRTKKPAVDAGASGSPESAWSSIFDEADAAVLHDLELQQADEDPDGPLVLAERKPREGARGSELS